MASGAAGLCAQDAVTVHVDAAYLDNVAERGRDHHVDLEEEHVCSSGRALSWASESVMYLRARSSNSMRSARS